MIIMHLLYGNLLQNILGIELLEPLYEVSTKAIATYNTVIHSKFREYFQYHTSGMSPTLGDIRAFVPSTTANATDHYNWTDATIIFCNSTLFPPELMDFISTSIEQHCRIGATYLLTHSLTYSLAYLLTHSSGTQIVTFTYKITSPSCILIDERNMVMSWGKCTVYIFKKSL